MKRFLVLILAFILLIGLAVPVYAITNGEPDAERHPYVGLVVFDIQGSSGPEPAWRATGILISPTVVLTAGHATDGAVAARVWFDESVESNPDYPFGGPSAHKGTPYTHPNFAIGSAKGLPGFSTHDVGVVILDEPVAMSEYGELPDVGLVDTLAKMTDVDLVGYGVQELITGGGQPVWTGVKDRLFAPAKIVVSQKAMDDEFVAITANPGQGRGGAAFGDSGGPVLLAGTDTILAVHSFQTNYYAKGITYACRVDIASVLEWIEGFLT